MSIDQINKPLSLLSHSYDPTGLDLSRLTEMRHKRAEEQRMKEDARYAEAQYDEARAELLTHCAPVTIEEYNQWLTNYLNMGGKITKISLFTYPIDRYYRPINTITALPTFSRYKPVSLLYSDDFFSSDIEIPPCIEILSNHFTNLSTSSTEVILYPDASPDLYQYVPLNLDEYRYTHRLRQTDLWEYLAGEWVENDFASNLLVTNMSELMKNSFKNRLGEVVYAPKDAYEVFESFDILMENVGNLGEKLQAKVPDIDMLLVRLYGLREAMTQLTPYTNSSTLLKYQKEIDYLTALVIALKSND